MVDLNNFNLVFYDLETTSLNLFQAEILELAASYPDGKTVFHSYVIHPGPIDNSDIHGITLETLKNNNAKPLRQVILDLEKWIETRFPSSIENKEPIYLVAHNNLDYDKWVLEANYRKLGKKIPSRWRFMDTLPQLRSLCNLPNYKLGTVYQEFMGQPLVGAHGALADTQALYQIYYHLINNIFFQNNSQEHVKAMISEKHWNEMGWNKISLSIFSGFLASNPLFTQLSSYHPDVLYQKIDILGIKGYPLIKMESSGFRQIKDLMVLYLVAYPNFEPIFRTRSQMTSTYYIGKINKYVEILGYVLYGIIPDSHVNPNEQMQMLIKTI